MYKVWLTAMPLRLLLHFSYPSVLDEVILSCNCGLSLPSFKICQSYATPKTTTSWL